MVVLLGAIRRCLFPNLLGNIRKNSCYLFAEAWLALVVADNTVHIAQNVLTLFVRKGADLFYNLFFDDLHHAP